MPLNGFWWRKLNVKAPLSRVTLLVGKYQQAAVSSLYEAIIPDFIASLDIGLNLIIETKGQYTDNADIKAKAAERWVNAVNEARGLGLWYYVVVKDPTELPNILNKFCASKWDATDSV